MDCCYFLISVALLSLKNLRLWQPGIQPSSPALEGKFLTTRPPGTSLSVSLGFSPWTGHSPQGPSSSRLEGRGLAAHFWEPRWGEHGQSLWIQQSVPTLPEQSSHSPLSLACPALTKAKNLPERGRARERKDI